MPIVYSWPSPSPPAIQTSDWMGDMYANPTGQLSEFTWELNSILGPVLDITQDGAHAGDSVNGKLMVGPLLAGTSAPNAYSAITISWFTFLPSGLPPVGVGSGNVWFQIAEVYGMPFAGSPSIGMGVTAYFSGQNEWVLNRDASQGYDFPWRGPEVTYDAWHNFSLDIVLSTDPNVGSLAITFDGARQTFLDGSQTLHYATLAPCNYQGPNRLILDQYRGQNTFSQAYTVKHAAPYFITPGC